MRLSVSATCVFALCFFLASCSSGGGSSTAGGGSNTGGGGATTDQPSVATSALPPGTVGAAYTTTMQAAHGTPPYTWTLTSGALPAGLSLNSAGIIAGTPSAIGTSSGLIFQVTDAQSVTALSSALSIAINPTALTVSTSSLTPGVAGTPYNAALQATGGVPPYSWTISAGSLPAGLTLTSLGVISGIPATSGNATGLTFEVMDSTHATASSAALSLDISPAALIVSTASLPAATVGTAYSASLSATGGVAPYTWTLTAGTLPPGLTVSSSGVIGGTPTAAGTFSGLTFQATDSNRSTASSSALSLQVNPAALSVATTSLPQGTVNVPYSSSLQATGGTPPYVWSLVSGTLPTGLSLSAAGVIAGTPTTAGASGPLVFQVTDSHAVIANSTALTLTVDPPLAITTNSLLSGMVGVSYSATLQATGGSGSYTWTLFSGTLPPGLSLSLAGGISGTPTTPGTFTGLIFQVTDTLGNTLQSTPLSLQIYNAQGCSAGSESLFGTQPYAFLLKGFSATNTPETIAGSFTPDGAGNITAGEEDDNNATASTNLPLIAANSSYTLGADNRGCINLATSQGTRTFFYSLTSSNHGGLLIEADATTTRGTGILRLQTPAAFTTGLSGPYGLLFSGLDSAGARFGMVGSLSAASGAFSTLALDTDDAGMLACNDGNPPFLSRCSTSLGSGTFTAADPNGRGTATLDASFKKSDYTGNYVYYIVNATEVLFASSDPLATNAVISGEALGTTGVYSASDLTGTFIGHGVGLGNNDQPIASLAIGTFDGSKAMSAGTLARDQAGSLPKYAFSGVYFVDATTGRVWFKDDKTLVSGQIVNHYPGISALVLGNDPQATTGVVEPQAATAPATGNLALGTEEDADYATANQIGIVDVGVSSFTGTENLSNSSGLSLNQLIPATNFTFDANGLGDFGTGSTNLALTNGSIYFIDESAGVTHPTITIATQ